MTTENQQTDEVMVTVKCLVYNHAPYLRQCLDGFVMQRTDFPFEVIVHDDASTDGSGEIIREYAAKYPAIIKPVIQTENLYSRHDGSLRRAVDVCCRGRYTAFCEGDDYWSDPDKLQRQVDYLEAHPECGLHYTRVERYDQSSGTVTDEWGGPSDTFEALLHGNTISTPSVMIRRSLELSYQKELREEMLAWKMGDYPQWLWAAVHSQIHFDERVTAVYRILPTSASHFTNVKGKYDFAKSTYDMVMFYAERYNDRLPEGVCKGLRNTTYEKLVSMAIIAGDSETLREIRDYSRRNPGALSLKTRIKLRMAPALGRFLQYRYKQIGYKK